jgi:3-phenylpropionate/cinnamic acid dioxygenase small subunit
MTDLDLTGLSAETVLRLELDEFFALESDLLDERRFEEWLDLLCDDVEYRVPIARNVHSAHASSEYLTQPLDVSWMDEGKETLTHRVAQMRTGMHWAEEPVSRTCHLYTNLRIVDVGSKDGQQTVTTRLKFLVYRNRLRTEEDFLVGKRQDYLVRTDGGWRIRRRLVLVDQTVLLSNNLTTFL